MATIIGRLSGGNDTITGSAANETIETPSSNTNLSASDVIDGGAGHDILLFERTSALGLHYANLAGLSGIEEFDVSASSATTITLDDAVLTQSDTNRIRITFDSDPLSLDLRALTAGIGMVEIAGTGTVTLYDAVAQEIAVADGFDGTVNGGAFNDTLNGGTGNDALSGGDGHDSLVGNSGNDMLDGGNDADFISGGAGADTLIGGAGADILTGGTGTNRVTGGGGADAFIVTAGETMTITDFAGDVNAWEKIDLRAFAGLTFADLTIAQSGADTLITIAGGTTIRLSGHQATTIHADMFVFDGSTFLSPAAARSTVPDFEFTDLSDAFTGTSANEVFEVKGNFGKLSGADSFDGNGGTDTLRVWGADRSLSASRVSGMNGIEIIDMSGSTGNNVVEITDTMVGQSDTGRILLRFGNGSGATGPGTLALDTATTGSAADVIVEGTAAVTLRDIAGQKVTISDNMGGNVSGQNKDDTVVGGAKNDSITGSGGHDSLLGNGGNDTIAGDDGNDTVSGGAGTNTVSGGTGTDRFVVSTGETVTITDFDTSDPFEKIDLRAFTGLDFAGLTIQANGGNARIVLPGGASITLTGVAASDVSQSMFIFHGESTPQQFTLTAGADSFSGGDSDDVFDLIGSNAQLDAAMDSLDGGAGIDSLRMFGSNTRFLGAAGRLDALSRFEVIDLTNSTGNDHEIEITGRMVGSSDTGTIVVKFGSATIASLDTATTGSAADVIIEGTGQVTLRDIQGQKLTISDAVNGNVFSQDKNDMVVGGAGHDRIDVDGGNDTISGGGGNDTMLGGDGLDLITGGTGTNSISGGTGTDRFVITASEQLTITDYDATDPYELIDLRAFAGLGFADLAIANVGGSARITLPDGTSILLNGVAVQDVTAANFIFDGQTPPEYFLLSDGADSFSGGAGNDLIDFVGTTSQLDSTVDHIAGGAGTDVLRVWGSDRVLGAVRVDALTGVEVIDLTNATGLHDVAIDHDNAVSSDTGSITLRFGSENMRLNTEGVTSASQVVIEGSGLVTLSDMPGQMLSISDAVSGNIQTGNDATVLIGGAGNDTFTGHDGDDSFTGNAGNDSLSGAAGNDSLVGGGGNDILDGGDGHDHLVTSGGGADTLTGGAGNDTFAIRGGSQGTVLTDYDSTNFVERIDLTALSHLTGMGDLTFTDIGTDVRVTATGLNITLRGVQSGQLDEDDFLFSGQDPLVFNVEAGTTNAQLQQLFDGAPPGAIINIAAGTYSITQTLLINRGDITVRGAGEGETIFVTDIARADASSTFLVAPDSLQKRYDKLGVTLTEGSNTITLPDTAALRAANPGEEYEDFQVGDIIFLFQPNDPAYLAASGNTIWNEPVTTSELEAELYYLREFRSRIVSIDNGVATLAEASPYTFEAGSANVARNTFLSNVTLSDFTIRGAFEDELGGLPDPFLFENTMAEWASIAALEFDGVRDSNLSRITIENPAAHAFKWQRAHETTADRLTAIGAYNKDGSSGYHFLFQESFANTLTNISSTDARHAVLFSSYNAEHYNNIHMTFSNRDINFHGSADSGNTIVIDRMVQDYPADGSTEQWRVVGPGVQGLHPNATIDANDVTFRYARTSDRSEIVVAHVDGGNIALGDGSDAGIGQGGNDTMNGDLGNDTLRGNGGDDILNGGDGKDELYGGDGNDVLRGGEDNDVLRGGAGDDVINGGANGDNLFGGAGRDTFLRTYADFTDNLMDFEAGVGGDILRIRGSAYTHYSQLNLTQVGADVILEFGPTGNTTFKNTQLSSLVAANFAFDGDNQPGQTIALKATDLFAVGTDKSDDFTVSRAHMDDPAFTILGGTGYDRIIVTQSSLNGDLGATGTYTGVEEFDLSGIGTLGLALAPLIVENPLVSQSNSAKLYLALGDVGSTVYLDIGPLGRGKTAWIDGARAVELAGGREHVVKSTDRIGTNITGDSLRDVIYGGRNNDVVHGGDGNDIIFGGAGDDSIFGDGGNDTLNGGPGSDMIYVDDAGDRVAESNRWAGHDTVIASVDFRMGRAHIEDVILTGTATLGAGNGLMNVITGNDQNNLLDGGKNVDTLIGGAGNDTYHLRTPGDNAVELAGEGIDTVKAFGSFTLGANIENLFIQLMTSKIGTPVQGLSGIGNELANTIVGNPYNNLIAGREGNDTLRGQAGADTFVFDRAAGAGNVDRIVDFSSAEGDRLRMAQSVFTEAGAGELSADAFVLGSVALDADDRFLYDQTSGVLRYDSDGDGADAAVQVAILLNSAALAASDIILI
jgi:Ca2+-binding RTX toxin-like protein